MFGVDTKAVNGGCGDPVQVHPGPPPPSPTQQDIEVRDRLIADQEALLNVYRCQFDVDTELVPDGCPDDNATPASLGPVPPLAEPWAERERLAGLLDDCGWWTGRSYRECEYPNGRINLVDQIKISRGFSEVLGCDTGYLIGRCFHGLVTNPGADTWEKRVELAEYQEACGYGRGRYWKEFQYWECSNDPLDPSAPARPEHNAEVVRLGSEAYDCDFQVLRDNHSFCMDRGGAGGRRCAAS
ncbi:MAG: hypothetical protein KTV68_14880 [Acidimicrobiia bacterium]|nr:hypothetical protein [Acidimicrobiia bacterium]